MDQKTQHNRVGTEQTTTCARCGAVEDGLPITWTCSVENSRRVYFCDRCGRENLRSIEGRLDSSWW